MRKFAAFLFALVFSSVLLYGVEDQNADIRYTRIDGKSAEIDFVLNKYEIRIVEYDGIKYSKIEYGGGSVLNKEGFAELPYFAASVQIEDLKNMDFSLEESDYDEVELEYPMLPSRGLLTRSMDISKVPYKISDESVTDSWYPEKVSYSTDPYIIRDVRGTSVVFYAYQYNSAKNILRINRSIKIRLTENDEQPVNPLYRKTDKVVSEMESVYRSVFINYNEAKALNIGDLGEILVVYTSQNGGLSGIQPYIEWKRQKGFTVNTLEVSNGTDLSVTGDIQTAYNGNPDILYVQIVGDFANIKSRVYDYGSLLSGANDPMLGWVAGSDYYQDIIVGRFSVQSEAQLAVQINKAINYEKNPETGGTWYAKGVGLASNEGAGSGDDGEGDEQHSEIIKNNKALPSSFTNYNTCYQSQSAGITEFSSYVNAGASYINYTGHGYYQEWSNPNITNTGVNNLINGTKLPYIISVACLVGNFNYASGDCFAEAWLKKENGGAVVGWFSTISQPWLPPMRGQDYFADILVGGYDYTSNPGSGTSTTEQRTTFGSLTINANHLMLAEAPTDADTRYTIETWTIFGDAALQVRRDTPKLITNSNTTLLPGNYSTTITATSGGAPVEGAMVTLYFNGENYTGLTNSSGVVSVDHNFTVGTDVTVTVSGFNLETEQAVFTVNGDTGGTFAVNQTSLSYGNVAAGSTSSQTFILTNDHT
ncbi:MAG: hypothetical protein JXN62_04465, partial [Bacteroidales bacterium]|nr:hypothetical protein [Bacteroidales bacterium]